MGWILANDGSLDNEIYWARLEDERRYGRSPRQEPKVQEPAPLEPFQDLETGPEWEPKAPAVNELPASERPLWVIVEDTDGYPMAIHRDYPEEWAQEYFLGSWLEDAATQEMVDKHKADGWPVYQPS